MNRYRSMWIGIGASIAIAFVAGAVLSGFQTPAEDAYSSSSTRL